MTGHKFLDFFVEKNCIFALHAWENKYRYFNKRKDDTVFEIHRKKSHSTLRAKRAVFTFEVDKSSLKMAKIVSLASFWKPEACSQTLLPDRSIWKGQKLVKNVKMSKFIYNILSYFQTMWRRLLGSCGLDKKTFQDSVKLLAKIRLLLFTFWPFVRTTVLAMQSNKCICIEARGLLGSSHVAFHFLWSYEVKPRSINFDTLNSQGGNARRMKPRLDFLQPSLGKKIW